ncbi:hypothetical protein JOQ06_000883 [Pogonophryne albipinna]|uniref:Uncharacterized protein n=1 Tax=Pogonophryne albipinna TaxID=1090488 RepID=A0AAD6B4A5_9TELE|nr:hypothetical protein JOQ06_000883 [Pogonophryne albipinna]
MLILSGDINLNPGPGHVQQTHTDGAPLSSIHCEQVAGAKHFVPRSVSVAMTGVASCGCGAAAVIGDPSFSWTRATQSCALSGETPHLMTGVASCGCGAAAVIVDPSISWTRATQNCALSGETPHLMTGVASCGCGAAAVIGDPSIGWTRATQSCALSGETPHLTCGPRFLINDTPVPVPRVQGELYDTIQQDITEEVISAEL